jgi:hypothetical protein
MTTTTIMTTPVLSEVEGMTTKISASTLIILLLILSHVSPAGAKSPGKGDLKHWPEGCSPREIGLKVAEKYLASPFRNFTVLCHFVSFHY